MHDNAPDGATGCAAEPYRPPLLLAGGHVQSILPALLRRVDFGYTRRERIDTPDGDFLDLDWAVRRGGGRLAILCHGLEGDTHRPYMRGMARALVRRGWDCLAWNYRGCSGSPNRRLRWYHSGAYEDLALVVDHAASSGRYDAAAVIGFSVGGNITLRWLGACAERIPPMVRRAVAVSVPCDLADSAGVLARPRNRLYMKHFLVALRRKIREKMKIMPGCIDDRDFGRLSTFEDFDNRYTAPLNGFADARDYWRRCSAKPVIPAIRVPTLMIQARNDPFLGPGCYPQAEAAVNPRITLEMPASGGHVGFIAFNHRGEYWHERRAAAFAAAGG